VATTFVNQAGHTDSAGDYSWLWALLFGVFYFMFKGVWRHVAIQVALIVVAYALIGEPATLLVLVLWVAYAVMARGIVEAALCRRGYKPANAAPPVGTSSSPPIANEAWAKALAECESPQRDAGLWARTFAQSAGDENKAKAAYVTERAKLLAAAADPRAGQLGSSGDWQMQSTTARNE
jgi:hypothetical protein